MLDALAAFGPMLALFALGVAAGIVNVLAGGGGLVALPALVLLGGLGDAAANGTFRVAVLAQSVVASGRLWRDGAIDWRLSARLAFPIVLGAALGAWQATTLGDGGTRSLLIGATLLATLFFIVGERLLPLEAGGSAARGPLFLGLLVAGWYGGLIQAGVGFVLLVVLRRLGRLDLPAANAQKVALVLLYAPLALAIFGGAALVDVSAGASLSVGMGLGAWWGAGLSIGPAAARRIRWAVAVMVLVAAARLVGIGG